MIAIGCYFVFIISLTGMTLSVEGRINEIDVYEFLNEIFKLHNKYRNEHGTPDLIRTPEMDLIANHMLDDMFMKQYNENYDQYGKNIYWMEHNENTELNTDEANRIFSKWYEKGIDYNYFFELLNDDSHNAFTQILWYSTDTIGLALRITYDKYVVQVVYLPCGNIPGQYGSNVFQRPIIAYINEAPLNQLIYDNDKRIFKDYIFHMHNIFRNKHNAKLLRRDEELDVVADNILNGISNNMDQNHKKYGKNSYEEKYNNYTILDKAEAESIFFEWYNKWKKYNYHCEPLNNNAAEFTQIVWNSTQAMGISMLRGEGSYKILVLYNPPGNIKGQFKLNVFIPRRLERGESSSSNN